MKSKCTVMERPKKKNGASLHNYYLFSRRQHLEKPFKTWVRQPRVIWNQNSSETEEKIETAKKKKKRTPPYVCSTNPMTSIKVIDA